MPVQEVMENGTLYRGPKYLEWRMNPDGISVPWSWVDYGLLPTGLLVADVDTDQHRKLAGYKDVIVVPEKIDDRISATALPTVSAALEAIHVPMDWATKSSTYRDVIRRMAHLFQFAQRHHGDTGRKIIDGDVSLDATIALLPANERVALSETADALGYETADIRDSWSMRQTLKYFGEQWGADPVIFGNLAEL